MDTGEILTVALVVLVPAALLWGVFLARSGRPSKRPAVLLGIPQALRPAPPDERLEGPRLMRIQAWGLISTLAIALFVPAYWLGELQRQQHFEEEFAAQSVERGRLIYATPPELPEESDPQQFKAVEREIALGMNCLQCHGPNAAGGQTTFTPPGQTKAVQYAAPPLNTVFQRWDEEIVRFTIERGRPGTPMPTWGVQYGGPMTPQMVDDVINWLKSLPGNQQAPEGISADCERPAKQDRARCGREIFEARCAVCHGPEGQGKEDDTLWHQGMALWKGDVRHLTKTQHLLTIQGGRRFAFMPQFAEAPPQGIPVPPYPLRDEQIDAVMRYERSL